MSNRALFIREKELLNILRYELKATPKDIENLEVVLDEIVKEDETVKENLRNLTQQNTLKFPQGFIKADKPNARRKIYNEICISSQFYKFFFTDYEEINKFAFNPQTDQKQWISGDSSSENYSRIENGNIKHETVRFLREVHIQYFKIICLIGNALENKCQIITKKEINNIYEEIDKIKSRIEEVRKFYQKINKPIKREPKTKRRKRPHKQKNSIERLINEKIIPKWQEISGDNELPNGCKKRTLTKNLRQARKAFNCGKIGMLDNNFPIGENITAIIKYLEEIKNNS